MRRADLVLAVAAALWLAPRESSALDRVVVLTPSETPVSARLRAELGALGVDTLTMAPPEDVSPAALEGIAFDKEALATIVLVGREQVVEIWIADRTTGKTVIRRVPVASDGIPDDVAVTKTVELFRASLLEVHLDAEAERKAPAAVQKIVGPTPLPARSEPTVTTRLGGAVAVGAALHW